MSDVVSGLLAKLDDLERLAEAAGKTGLAFMWARQNGRSTMKRWLSEVADPASVLRLCRAHRQIVERHRQADAPYSWMCQTCGESGQETDCTYPCDTLRDLAVGLGVEEQSSE